MSIFHQNLISQILKAKIPVHPWVQKQIQKELIKKFKSF